MDNVNAFQITKEPIAVLRNANKIAITMECVLQATVSAMKDLPENIVNKEFARTTVARTEFVFEENAIVKQVSKVKIAAKVIVLITVITMVIAMTKNNAYASLDSLESDVKNKTVT